MTYEKHITRITVMPKGEYIFSVEATHIEIRDNGAGPFIALSQHSEACSEVSLTLEDWPMIRDAIDFMFINVCNKMSGGSTDDCTKLEGRLQQ